MKSIHLYTTLILLLALASNSMGQDYNNAIRLSYGNYLGISYKRMFDQEQGAMASVQYGENSLILTGLRVFETPAFPETSSKWFFSYGYGVHMAYRTKIKNRNLFRPFAPAIVHEGHFISPGIDGYLGLEYRFLKYPFTVSADLMPNFEFFGPGYFRVNLNTVSVTAAFVF
ncbi:hypothetical protein [Carboxylicivirga sp. RSCT41]|uniref:hypothetical protein n=1 Tax=Carboxylicivirga agarovorans TaxID=3417570 RepID=UPI003D342B20